MLYLLQNSVYYIFYIAIDIAKAVNMTKNKNLGEFEILMLAALIRLGENAYGVAIRSEIETRTGRNVAIGALYATLARLEAKDYVASKMGEATAERGGRAKRYYKITPTGQAQLEKSVLGLGRMLDGITAWPQVQS